MRKMIGYVVTLASVFTGAILIIISKIKEEKKQIAEKNWEEMKLLLEKKERWNKDHRNVVSFRTHEGCSFSIQKHKKNKKDLVITFFREWNIEWSIHLKKSPFFGKSEIQVAFDNNKFLSYIQKDKIQWEKFQSWVYQIEDAYHKTILPEGDIKNWYLETVEKAQKLIEEKKEKAKRVITPSSTSGNTGDVEGLKKKFGIYFMGSVGSETKETPFFQDIFEKMKELEREGVYLSTEEHHILTRTFPKDLHELQMMYDGLDEKGKENMKGQIQQTKMYMEKVLSELEGQIRERKTIELKTKMNVIQQRVTLDE